MKEKRNWLLVIILSLVFTLFLGNTYDPLFVIGLLLGSIVLYGLWKKSLSFHPVDGIVMLLWLYHLILPFFSLLPAKSLAEVNIFSNTVLYYFILRIYFQEFLKIKGLLFAYSLIFLLLSLIFLYLFFRMRGILLHQGEFNHIYDMRFVFKPFGFVTNAWASIVLCGLGICFAALGYVRPDRSTGRWILVSIFVLIYSLLLSFSRGIYITLGLLIIAGFIFLVCSKKLTAFQKLGVIIIPAMVFLLAMMPFRTEAEKTVGFNKTLSQQRSISGRVESIRHSKLILEDNLFFGVGPGNYSLAINDFYEDERVQFNPIAPNSYIQILTEQGILGLLLWFILFICVVYYGLRGPRQNTKIVTVFILLIAIREGTFPALYNQIMQVSIFTLIALVVNDRHFESSKPWTLKRKKRVIFVLSGILTSLFILSLVRENYRKKNDRLLNENSSIAVEEIESGISQPIHILVNRGIYFRNRFIQSLEQEDLNRSLAYLEKASRKNPKDNMLTNLLAEVYLLDRNGDIALTLMKPLLEKFPNNSLYNLTAYKIYNQLELEELSHSYFSRAIKYNPNLMKSAAWKNLHNDHPDQALRILSDIKTQIASESGSEQLDPITSAIYGRYLFMIEDYQMAKVLLSDVVTSLPNLLFPWYCLGEIEYNDGNDSAGELFCKRFLLISYGPFSSLVDMNRNIRERAHKKAEPYSVYGQYAGKFNYWYGNRCFEITDF